MEQIILYTLLAVQTVLLIILLGRSGQDRTGPLQEQNRALQGQLESLRDQQAQIIGRQDVLTKGMSDSLDRLDRSMEALRQNLQGSMRVMQESNDKQLQQIRRTVDEQLQDALEKKLTESFKQVSERLEQVYRGLGEMQNVAASVGDLKKVLSNVKTRGILGEIQLGAILEQILSPEQYEENIATKKGSADRVEFAVKLPGEEGSHVWLPIDAKFPLDAYSGLLEAYESADPAAVESAIKLLKDRVLRFAKDIHDKYISVPETTEFAIMFVPTEGLYAELVRIGMIEELQRKYRVSLTGPTTMGALLNSLQMGFKTLAIQKRSSEVWTILGKVKGEFDTFAAVLQKTQERINQANQELDKLVGVRTRGIQRALKTVESLPLTAQEQSLFITDNREDGYV